MTTTTRQVRRERHPLRRRILTVQHVEELSPAMRRIVLGGPDLESDFPFRSMAPGDHVKVFFPDPATGVLTVPHIDEHGMVPDPNGPTPIHRDYTVRAFDPAAGTLTIDFVVHRHGVAGVWADRARPGDELGVLGPRGSHHFPDDYPWYVLAADATAVPALSRWIEELPAEARGVAIVEIDDADERQELVGDAGIEVRYLYRTPDGGSRLERALRELSLPTEDYFVWAAGEAGMLKGIRRYFRTELGRPKETVHVDGYWRRGVTDFDHHAPIEDD